MSEKATSATISPSISELTIQRHMRDDGDAVLNDLRDALKLLREKCIAASDTAAKVLADKMQSPPANHRRARDATFRLLEVGSKAVDAAMASAQTEIDSLAAIVKGPPGPKDSLQLAMQRELREALARLPEPRRREIIDAAVASGDDALVSAVLSVPAWVSGMSPAELAMVQHGWARKHRPAELDRMTRLRAACDDVVRVSPLAISFVHSLTNQRLIEEAEATERAAREALSNAKAS